MLNAAFFSFAMQYFAKTVHLFQLPLRILLVYTTNEQALDPLPVARPYTKFESQHYLVPRQIDIVTT
jgi:hypothetical protein